MKHTLYNDNWLFWNDGDSFALVWTVPDRAQMVSLPHDAMITEKPYAESKNGGNTGFRDGGNYVYVKTFTATKEDLEKRVVLKLEGSYMNTFVYVNGQLAGKHHNGYTTFYVPLHEFLRLGENEIRIQVRNGAMNNSRWYSGSGLYRDVYLLQSDLLHIGQTGARVLTTGLEKEIADIHVRIPVWNESSKAQHFRIALRVLDEDGQLVCEDVRPYFFKAGEQNDITTHLVIDQSKTWSAETPVLYQLQVELLQKDEIIDQVAHSFGIRTIAVDSKRGFRINGQTVKLRGACIHHDSGLLGAATYEAVHERQMRILKDAGFNAIRMAHHPAAPALLRACDKVGMYVMDETFDMWTRFKGDFDYSLVFEEQWRKDVTAMVETDFNHPCVVLYSIGNEIPEIATAHGSRLAKAIHDHIKQLDPSRPTLAGINGVFAASDAIPRILSDVVAEKKAKGEEIVGNVNDFMSLMDSSMDQIVVHPIISQNLEFATAATDIAGYNYMTARYDSDRLSYPHRVIVGSETYPPEIARNWRLVETLPNVIGDFTWTGWDYIGEAGVGVPAYQWGEGGFGAGFPCQLAYCGDVDITGFRRPLSYYREIVFGLRKQPYIAVQKPEHVGKQLIKTPWVMSDAVSSWTWPQFEGKPIVVEVYAPGDEVALYLEDQLIARKQLGEHYGQVALFETTYQPGTLKAVAYEKGNVVSEVTLATADGAHLQLVATVEKVGDFHYIIVELVDQEGRLMTAMDSELHLSLSGAHMLGFGSGNPKPAEHYGDDTTTLYNGRALAIVQKENDTATATFSGGGLTVEVSF